MRANTFLMGAALSLALAAPAAAQQSSGGQFMSTFNGVNPRNWVSVPIDTASAMKTFNTNSAFRTPTQQKAFSLSTIFPKISMPTWPPRIPTTPILSQQNNPFQPNAIVGINPFSQTPTK